MSTLHRSVCVMTSWYICTEFYTGKIFLFIKGMRDDIVEYM